MQLIFSQTALSWNFPCIEKKYWTRNINQEPDTNSLIKMHVHKFLRKHIAWVIHRLRNHPNFLSNTKNMKISTPFDSIYMWWNDHGKWYIKRVTFPSNKYSFPNMQWSAHVLGAVALSQLLFQMTGIFVMLDLTLKLK